MLTGGTILVTGGTGTFGKAFTKYLLNETKVDKVIILSRDEFKQYQMAQEFNNDPRLRFFNGDIRDRDRLQFAFRSVDYVVHAAAMKQVPACEYDPFEAVKTNIIGAQNIIEAAIMNKVKRVVAISTDKAVAPINLYGSTKLAMERLFLAAPAYTNQTTFGLVRYGNVAGSRGSVIPFFMNLHKQGKTEFPLTHIDMTRFNIFIEDGVELVMKTLIKHSNGQIFIPKIASFRVADLITAINPKATIQDIGVRKGEKIHETLISTDEFRNYPVYFFDDHYVIATHEEIPKNNLQSRLSSYNSGDCVDKLSVDELREVIQRLGYEL